MKNNSFELALNKLLILYIINNFQHKLKENDLNYFVMDIELFNYFYFKQYLQELESTGLVLFDRDKKYYLSEDGTKTLEVLYEKIPEENIDFINKEMEKYNHELNVKNSVSAEILKEDSGIYNHLMIKDGDINVLDLKIEVSDENMAKNFSKNFKKNADKIYSEILKLLSNSKLKK